MKLKVSEVIGIGNGAAYVLKQECSFILKYKLGKVIDLVNEAIKPFNENRTKVLDELKGEDDELPNDKKEEFKTLITEMLNDQVEVELPTLNLSYFENLNDQFDAWSALKPIIIDNI